MKYVLLCLLLVGCSNDDVEYETALANRAMNKWCTADEMNIVIKEVNQCTARGMDTNHCWNVGIVNVCGDKHGRAVETR